MILKPIFAQVEITEGCTHNCIHCYNYYSENRLNNPFKEGIIDLIIKNELFYITLTGGEPLMKKNVLFKSIEKLKENNIDISLNSNLYLLEKEDAKILGNLELEYILSSILSSKEKLHDKITQRDGSFKKLIKSLDYLINNHVNVSLNMVVSQDNINNVYETGKFVFDKLGIKRFSATPIVPSSEREIDLMLDRKEYIKTLDELLNLEKDFGITSDSLHPAIPCMFKDDEREKYRKFFERRGCAAGKGAITFSPIGDVRVCSHERRIYGNILKNSFEEILNNMDQWSNRLFTPSECKFCTYTNKCNGGCRVSAEVITGKINGLDPYYIKSIKENIPKKRFQKEIENVKAIKGNIRYREDTPEIITIYVNSSVNARLNKLDLEIFKRFVVGRDYKEITKELGDKDLAREIVYGLVNKGLLV